MSEEPQKPQETGKKNTDKVQAAKETAKNIAGAAVNKADELYSPDNAHQNLVKKYQEDFVNHFGEISPNETWDFSLRGSSLAAARTRSSNKASVQNMSATESYGYLLNK